MSTTIYQPKPEEIKQSVTNIVQAIAENPENPEKAKATFSARSELKDGLLATLSIRDFTVLIDEPESLGGTNLAPNPVEVVLGALGACQEIVIKAYSAVLGIQVDSVNVEAHGNIDLRGFLNISEEVRPGFESVEFKTTINTPETDAEKLASLKYFAETRCPVLDIVKNAVTTTGTVLFKQPELVA